MTRRLPSLPTGTPAVGTTQVADAPNDGNNGTASLPGRGTRGRVADPPPVRRTRIGLTDRGVSCGQGPQLTCALRSQQRTPEGSPRSAAENNARSGRSRALRACAAKPRSFPPPRGRCAPRKRGRASPGALPVRFRRLIGRGIAPAARRPAGCCRLVRSSVAGCRRLWPKANRRRRWGSQGRSPSCPFLVPFLGKQERNSPSVDYRQVPPPTGRKISNHSRGGTRQLRRSLSGKSKGEHRCI